MLPLSTHLHDFEGQPLVTLTWNGRPCWVARQIAARIGYGHDGKRLPNKILGDWSREFIAGHDYALLQGAELHAFHAAVAAEGLPTKGLGRGSLLVLFESGLHLVLTKTNLEIGERLRRFLADRVLPQLVRTGRYSPEASEAGRTVGTSLVLVGPAGAGTFSPTERREARLALQARSRARWVDVCDRRLRAGALYRLVDALGDQLDADARTALEVVAAEIATGLELAELVLPDPGADGMFADALRALTPKAA